MLVKTILKQTTETFRGNGKGREYEKESIENVMAGSSVFMSWNRSSGSDPADFTDNTILAGGIFLFCKGIGEISQVVSGDETLQKSSGQLCKGACHDIKDKAVYSASCICNADVCIFYDEQSAGAYFYSSADPF